MKKYLIFVFYCFLMSNLLSQSKKEYVIYSVKEEKVLTINKLIKAIDTVDVLFYGEEHNDSIAHLLQQQIYKKLHSIYDEKVILSLEMFDREVQHVMDEYLKGLIKERFFNSDSHQWNNYEDYKPLVEYAKSNGLRVICANAPFRYVNLVSNKGLDTLQMISNQAKETLAPIPYPLASKRYKEKLVNLMGEYAYSTNKGYDLSRGQALWDATMAYSISQTIDNYPKAKVFHLNGKFHTDESLGIIESMNYYKPHLKKLIISSQALNVKLKNIDFKAYHHLGDIIIFTIKK